MKKNTFSRSLLILAVLAALAAPVNILWANDLTQAEGQDMASARIMGHIHQKATITTIYAGELGFYYTVKTRDGRIIGDRIPQRELQSRFEDIHRDVTQGYARVWAGR